MGPEAVRLVGGESCLSTRFSWKCPAKTVIYRSLKNTSAPDTSMLGTGTGFYPAHASLHHCWDIAALQFFCHGNVRVRKSACTAFYSLPAVAVHLEISSISFVGSSDSFPGVFGECCTIVRFQFWRGTRHRTSSSFAATVMRRFH